MATMLLTLSIFCLCVVLIKSGMVMLTHTKPPKELPAPEQDTSADFACDALVTRVFEQRMVDAGIMEVIDMTMCENAHSCKDCNPTFVARSLKSKQGFLEEHKKKSLEAQAKVKELSRVPKPKPLMVGGQEIPWPEHVPKHAAVEVMHPLAFNRVDYYLVRWLWIDQKTAKQKVYSIKVADLGGFTESVIGYSDQNEKPIMQYGPPRARKELIQQLREDARNRPKRANPGYF